MGKFSDFFPAKFSKEELAYIKNILKTGNYIVLRRCSDSLFSVMVSAADNAFYSNGAYWSHSGFVGQGSVPNGDKDFYVLHSHVKGGVHYENNDEFFGIADGAAILVPKNFTPERWKLALDFAKKQLGKPYDLTFNHKEHSSITCSEFIYMALEAAVPNLAQEFPKLYKAYNENKLFTPQMIYETKEFDIVYEKRHSLFPKIPS